MGGPPIDEAAGGRTHAWRLRHHCRAPFVPGSLIDSYFELSRARSIESTAKTVYGSSVEEKRIPPETAMALVL
jgi:hypothetical protein